MDALPSTTCLHAYSPPTIFKNRKMAEGTQLQTAAVTLKAIFLLCKKNGAVHTKSTRHGEPEWAIKTYKDKKKAVDQDIGQ